MLLLFSVCHKLYNSKNLPTISKFLPSLRASHLCYAYFRSSMTPEVTSVLLMSHTKKVFETSLLPKIYWNGTSLFRYFCTISFTKQNQKHEPMKKWKLFICPRSMHMEETFKWKKTAINLNYRKEDLTTLGFAVNRQRRSRRNFQSFKRLPH
jgi:hypothetical protein